MAKWSAVNEEFTRDDLAKVRELVHTAATEARLHERADDLVLAVNEVVSNAIRYAGGRGHLTVEHVPDGLLVEVCDHGPGLPPAITSDPPSPDATGGRGMWLIRKLCPDLEIISGPSGVTVRLFMTTPDASGSLPVSPAATHSDPCIPDRKASGSRSSPRR